MVPGSLAAIIGHFPLNPDLPNSALDHFSNAPRQLCNGVNLRLRELRHPMEIEIKLHAGQESKAQKRLADPSRLSTWNSFLLGNRKARRLVSSIFSRIAIHCRSHSHLTAQEQAALSLRAL